LRITSKGQVTIPAEIRAKLGLLPETEVDFVLERNGVRIVRRRERGRGTRGEKVVRRLRGSGTVHLTTDQIMALTRKP
jgi:AbrB family looped-hinge helix DNA binding protein